jgi:hypothetical protein
MRAASPPCFNWGIAALALGPAASAQIKIGAKSWSQTRQWDRALGKDVGQKAAVESSSGCKRPPFFFCFRSESSLQFWGFWPESSPACLGNFPTRNPRKFPNPKTKCRKRWPNTVFRAQDFSRRRRRAWLHCIIGMCGKYPRGRYSIKVTDMPSAKPPFPTTQ